MVAILVGTLAQMLAVTIFKCYAGSISAWLPCSNSQVIKALPLQDLGHDYRVLQIRGGPRTSISPLQLGLRFLKRTTSDVHSIKCKSDMNPSKFHQACQQCRYVCLIRTGET